MPGRIPRVLKTEAIVLRRRRLGESDRVVTLLTAHRGKRDAVAKGTLRPRSKLAGHLEPMMLVEVVLAHGRNLDIVTQAESIEGFEAIRADLDRVSAALYLLELADRFTLDQQEADATFELLHTALRRLERGDGIHLVTRSFELALLAASGYAPQWNRCVACGAAVAGAGIGGGAVAWSPGDGGVLCPGCRAEHPAAQPVDGTVLRVLRAMQAGPYEQAARIRLTPELAAAMERVMHALMQATAERELGSAHFVAEARRAGASGRRPDPTQGDR